MCQLLETVCRTNAANQGDAAWSKGRNRIRNCVASQLFHSLVPTRDTWGSLTPSVTIESSSWPPTWCGCCFRIVDADRHPVFCWHSKPWSSADSTPLISVDCGAPHAACLSHTAQRATCLTTEMKRLQHARHGNYAQKDLQGFKPASSALRHCADLNHTTTSQKATCVEQLPNRVDLSLKPRIPAGNKAFWKLKQNIIKKHLVRLSLRLATRGSAWQWWAPTK